MNRITVRLKSDRCPKCAGVRISLIAHTTSQAGLVVKAALDTGHYETGIVVSDEELARVRITPAKFHGEWNYTIRPKV